MKKFKTKKKINKKIFLVFFLLLCLISFIYLSFKKSNKSYHSFINYLLDNTSFKKGKDFNLSNLISNLDLFLYDYKFKEKSHIVFNDRKEYIYLYNTHDHEKYYDNTMVTDASLMLFSNLKKLGINALVEEDRVSNYQDLGLGNYEVSRKFIESIKKKENITYFIDIHRDSVSNTTVEINKKKYAKIMFVLGLDNPNFQNNKKIMEKMNDYLNENYPGISRGIYEKQGRGVDGVYNQDIDSHVILIEIGGMENNYEEVNNSTEIIALMLYNMLGDN